LIRELPITLRPMEEQDRAFIYDSWVKSYEGSAFGRLLNSYEQPYGFVQGRIIGRILESANVLVAAFDEDPRS
jgi:hypothetical protein